ncbi:MAG TPA: cupin domain-containing protein [Rhizobiaceae bacterium]|nr:cupin domain-containing protein [Rhizobiaceae bacterium]
MAALDAELWNPVSRTRAVFTMPAKEGQGRLLEVDWFVAPGERLPSGKHVHEGPQGFIGERFTVFAGQCTMVVGEKRIDAATGDVVEVPVNTTHVHPWNTGASELHVRQSITPDKPNLALTSGVEKFFESLVGFSQTGKADRDGNISSILQQALTINTFLMPWTYPAGIPALVRTPAFAVMAALARLTGLKPYCAPDWTLRG